MRIAKSLLTTVAAVAASLSITSCGTAPPDVSADGAVVSSNAVMIEECESALLTLEALLARSAGSVMPARLEEARELQDIATELYLRGDFRLALELIDEAIALLAGAE